jgi:pimeloyl-ACP methyl ester carboxylesterase
MACAPLCLVPGLGLAVQAWEPTLAALHDLGVQVPAPLVVLLPGYGEPGRGLDLSPAASAQRLHGALSERTTGAVVLVGHSASCQVVAQVAAQWPEAVRALVLIGPTTDPRAGGWPRLLGRWLRTAVWEPWWQLPTLLRQYARTGPWTMLRAMDAARRDPIDASLRAVTCPILLVRGAHDRIAPRRWVDGLASLRRGTLPGDGKPPPSTIASLRTGAHMIPLTHPRLVAAEISRFLAALEKEG